MAKGHEYEQQVLAKRVLAIMRAVAGGSPTKFARILNGVDPNAVDARTDERAPRIESDRRLIARWLAADALMDESSRVKLLAVANQRLALTGAPPLPEDFLTFEEPDPLVEISRKLDLLLADRGLRFEPDATEADAALQRLERDAPARDGRASRRIREGGV